MKVIEKVQLCPLHGTPMKEGECFQCVADKASEITGKESSSSGLKICKPCHGTGTTVDFGDECPYCNGLGVV